MIKDLIKLICGEKFSSNKVLDSYIKDECIKQLEKPVLERIKPKNSTEKAIVSCWKKAKEKSEDNQKLATKYSNFYEETGDYLPLCKQGCRCNFSIIFYAVSSKEDGFTYKEKKYRQPVLIIKGCFKDPIFYIDNSIESGKFKFRRDREIQNLNEDFILIGMQDVATFTGYNSFKRNLERNPLVETNHSDLSDKLKIFSDLTEIDSSYCKEYGIREILVNGYSDRCISDSRIAAGFRHPNESAWESILVDLIFKRDGGE